MKSQHPYDMKKPCEHCPFRRGQGYLTEDRVHEIATTDGEFPCHKTTDQVEDEDGGSETVQTKKSKVCAGFMIFREKQGQPNQMMRIAQRIGMYNPKELMKDNPEVEEVYDDIDEMADAHYF